jgi:bifunctional non-homologous end joining protein LigD
VLVIVDRSLGLVRSCLIDGEAIVCDENGLAVFDLIRRHGALASAVHCAFDLLELNGEDLRRQPIEERKWRLANLLDGSSSSMSISRRTARLCSAKPASSAVRASCRSPGRSSHWVKVKNPNAPAVKREAEEDWGR